MLRRFPRWISLPGLSAFLFLATPGAASPDEGELLSPEQLTDFLGPNATSVMTWTAVNGPDFIVYYGTAKPPLSGSGGIYLGNHPSFEPNPTNTIVPGKLGIFQVKWRRTISPGTAIHYETVISLDDYGVDKAHVWVTSQNESDVSQLIADFSKLPTFSHQHESEFYKLIREERRRGMWASVISGGLFVIGAWLLDRVIRRRDRSGLRRGLALGAYSIGWGLLVCGVTMLPDEPVENVIRVISISAARGGFFIIVGFVLLSLVLSLAIVAVSLLRRGRRRDVNI
jgi:hypothetical protein